MDITFKLAEGHFNYRVAGIFIHDGKVLVMKDGRSSVERLCYIVESFFIEEVSQEKFHEVAFYYLLSVPDSLIAEGDEFTRTEGKKTHRFYWKAISELPGLYFQPGFLKGRLDNLPEHPEHLVIWE